MCDTRLRDIRKKWKSNWVREGGKHKLSERSKVALVQEHDPHIRPACAQTSAVSEHTNNIRHQLLWNEVKLIDCDPHWYTQRVKETIHLRPYPNNVNRDSGIQNPEAWMPIIKRKNKTKQKKKAQPESRMTADHQGNNSQTSRIKTCKSQQWKKPTKYSRASCFIKRPETSRPYHLMKTSSMQSKHPDLHHK